MKHFVKTARGISESYIKFNTQQIKQQYGLIMILMGLIGGVGQGGGASPIIWMAVLMIMLAAYKAKKDGAVMTDTVTGETIKMWIVSYVDDNSIVKHFSRRTTVQEILEEMRKCLEEWQKLLQITGGDLSLGKCKISIMKWRYRGPRGNPEMVSKEEYPGTVVAESVLNQGSTEQLERLNPWEAEKILGVHLPPNGSMEIEAKMRKKKLDKFGNAMIKAPLNPIESHIAYKSRYVPKATYPFPVTLFTTTQLHEMQRKAVFYMLPKMGINRHAPRAMIYGPMRYGGRQLTDLRVEQPVAHVRATLGHMRRGGNVGKALEITLRDTQVEIGISMPFYLGDPHIYNYGTKQTRWRYFWETMWQFKITPEIYNMWTPYTPYDDDANIMETAVRDSFYRGRENYRLVSINRCRIYLRIFYFSKMMTDNREFEVGYITGAIRYQQNAVHIPDIQKPTALEWSEWKSFIFKNFLHGKYIITTVPNTPNHSKQWEDTTEIKQLRQVQRGTTVQTTIHNFPKELVQLIQKLYLPEDNCDHLAKQISEGTIVGACDGSLIPGKMNGHGGHAFTIQEYNKDNMGCHGWGVTPESDSITSTTTEQYALIIILLVLYAIQKHKQITRQKNIIYILTDSKETEKRANDHETPFNVSETLKTDYDLWQLIIKLQQINKLKMKVKWIKAHQDEDKHGNRIIGPLSREVSLNCQVDALAKQGAKAAESGIRICRTAYSTTKIALYGEDGIYIQDLQQYILLKTNGKDLKEYIKTKFEWEEETFNLVNWYAIAAALKTYKPYKRTKVSQLMFNWQYVGERKNMMEEADGVCPTGCGDFETKLHYIFCKSKEMITRRARHRSILLKQLQVLNTYPGIQTAISNAITTGWEREWINTLPMTTLLETELCDTVCEQSNLHINHFLQGYLINKWELLQQRWVKTSNSQRQENWTKEVITIIHTYVLEIWKERNEVEHGITVEKTLQRRREKAKKRVAELYQRNRKNLTAAEKNYFKVPIAIRKKLPIDSMEIWIKQVEMIFKKRKEKTQTKMDSWLNRTTPVKSWKERLKHGQIDGKKDDRNR